MSQQRTDLELANELFDFLQGDVPKGLVLRHVPRLDAPTAATILYVLSEHFKDWYVPDSIELCDVCGELYDDNEGGTTLDFGEEPCNFCDECDQGTEYRQKITSAAEVMGERTRQMKQARASLLAWADAFESDDLTRQQAAARLRLLVEETLGGDQ